MKRILDVVIIILALILIGVILFPQWQESKPAKIRLGCDSTISSILFLTAKNKGFLKNERLLPEIELFSNSQEIGDALFKRKIDCAILPWSYILERIEENSETMRVFIAGEFRTSLPVDGIFVLKESKIKNLKELKGKVIGYPKEVGSIVPMIFERLGVVEGKFIEFSNSALEAALNSKKVDAVFVIEPERARALRAGHRALDEGVFAKYSAPYPGIGIGYTTDFLLKNRTTCARLKRGMDMTVGFLETNIDECRSFFSQFFGIPLEDLSEVRVPEYQRLVEINRGAIQTFAYRLKEAGVLKEEIDTRPIFVEPGLLR